MNIDVPDEDGLGPAMLALNERQRRFVIAALDFPTGKDWQIAKAAGYPDRSHGSLRVCAHRLFHNEKVIAALGEEADKRMRASAVLGVSVLAKIARTDGHKHQLRAAEALLNRIGFHERTEHKVTIDRKDTDPASIEKRIARAMERLAKLGRLPVGLPAPIEGDFKVIDGK